MNTEETITISKELYWELQDTAAWLECLEAAGVDNWEGYGFALEIQRDREG